ncbi:MAG: hypothetical protein CMJ81_16260 [Planctomycetaceae bacterium]|nr:hypothetical protein [Planctomycetaceae bacterium]
MDGKRLCRILVAWFAVLLLGPAIRAEAHFIWLDSGPADSGSQAVLFFGEGPHERDHRLPDSLGGVNIQLLSARGVTSKLKTAKVEAESFVGLQAEITEENEYVLQTVARYGVYRGMLLTYYAKHIHCRSQDGWSQFSPSPDLHLEIVPELTTRGIACTVLWHGKPLAESSVTLSRSQGDSIHRKTGADGRVLFEEAKGGKFGFYANFTDKSSEGEFSGEKYSGVTHCATLIVGSDTQGSTDHSKTPRGNAIAAGLPDLPEAVASFGAAVLDGWLYVYGGHIGGAHEHSRDNLSSKFVRLELDGGTEWEELTMETPLQGLALVSDGEFLYRVGGMNARNAANEDDDLHSSADFARFDPRSKTWKSMPPLPEPRSSHDAVVIGDKLYVSGGWELKGPGNGQWHKTAWVFLLNASPAQWQCIPEPPFQRRALAASHHGGRLVVLGGMNFDNKVSQSVDIFDPATQAWSKGSAFPGGGIDGFGISAWNLGGTIYASGMAGVIYQLSPDGSRWLDAGRLKTPRFFHRLLPRGKSTLLVVAGASMKKGHLADSELLAIDTR